MDGFRGAVDAVAAILRRVLLRDPSNRREACTWLAALIGRVQLPPALRRALVCRLVARSGSLDPGASDRSLLRQLLQLLCEERPKDAARLLMHDPDLIRSFFAANPHRILLWFDHFSLGPGSQGGRWGEEGERSREQQRPSAYAATAYAGSGSGSAHTKLAGSAAAGDALHRDSPGSGRLVLPTRALVRNHRFGAQALAEFAFAHREDHWHRLVWAGKHAQTPVTVAARPHYFCELDISGTMKNFLREVPEFWSSHELRKTLQDGALLSLDISFFVEELMRRLVREMEDERRRRGWEEGVEEVLRTERREGDGRDVRRGWRVLLAGCGDGRRGGEGRKEGGPDRREGGRKREDGRERERGIERERGRLKEGGGDGWAGARERRGREGRVIEMGVGAGMVEAQGMMDEVLIGACWDGDEERIRGGRREEDEEWSRRERRERDKERNSRRARDVKADQLASLPSLDSLSSFERLLLLVAGACHGRQTALLLLREPEWADEREELTAVLRASFDGDGYSDERESRSEREIESDSGRESEREGTSTGGGKGRAVQGKAGSPQREASGRAKRVSVAEIYAVERLDEAAVKGSLLGPAARLHRLAIHTFRKAADRWTPVQLVLSHADVSVCQQWVDSIQSLLRADPERPRNLLAFINPIGGHRKALKTWAAVKPVFDRAGVAVTEVVTQRQNHAFDAVYGATDEEISAVDGILVVGGDGLFNEVLNGLAKRRHHAPPCIHPSRLSSARLSLPPSSHLSSTPPPLASSGSPAALSSAAPVTGSRDPTTAALHVVLGHRMPLDVARITTWKEEEQAGKQGEQSEEEKEEEGQRKEGEQAETGGEIGGSGGREEGGEGEAELVREGFAGGDGREKAGGAGSETEGAKAKTEEEEEDEGVERCLFFSHLLLPAQFCAPIFFHFVFFLLSFSASGSLPFPPPSYGFYGDVIRRSEGLRWMGPARYDYAGLMTYLHHRSYDAEVSYFDVHPSAGPAPRPAIQASPVQAAGLEASPSTAAESDASAVQAAATLGESPSQGVLAPPLLAAASPLEAGPVRGLERSFTDQLPRTHGLDDDDEEEEEEVGEVEDGEEKVGEEVVEEDGGVGGEGKGEVEGGGEGKVLGGGDGEGKGEGEGMPLQAVEWNGRLRRRTFSSPMLVKTRSTDLSQLARASHSLLTLDTSSLDLAQISHSQSGAATSAPVGVAEQEGLLQKGGQSGEGVCAVGGMEKQSEGLRPCWRTVRGKFHSVGAAVMSCRNDKAPDGVAAQAHLADGNLHLILIRKCSRPEYLHQLTRLARKGADPFAFEFVETYKTPAFMFTSHGKQSTWNVDGELVVASQLSAQVFRGLVDIFASGPEF
ncbi:unnamed protein product [Closterium sp. NIES-64]|nr:unnamed protein product [Closterium sp. NIES-64]